MINFDTYEERIQKVVCNSVSSKSIGKEKRNKHKGSRMEFESFRDHYPKTPVKTGVLLF
jgi:hypothetical protein